ncbi:MAG TPA: VOC family protein [Jatrophihabitans sp.]|jgi:predicted lactoylglutathione lyase
MPTKLFVNLPVKDLDRSKEFFTALGLPFYGATEDIASVIISEHTQVMLLAEPTFAGYARNTVADPSAATEVILAVGLETKEQVDDLLDKALTAGADPIGETRNEGGRYQRAFADLDGHHWEALCLV